MQIQAFFYNNPDTYPPIVNGVRLLAGAGYQVDLFSRATEESWGVRYPGTARVHRLGAPGRGSWLEYARYVRLALGSGRPSAAAFVGHDMHGLLPARLLASRYRKPLLYHCHDFADNPVSLPRGSRVVKAFEQRFARTADLVVVPDQERGTVMARALRLKEMPLVAANAPLRRAKGSGQALRERLAEQLPESRRIVLRQGRIASGHALETTVRSLPYWQDTECAFVLMGIPDPAFVERLRELAASLGVPTRLVILPPVGYDELGDFTPGADIGHALYEPVHVNNRTIATASNKIMEYMAAGVPLVVSDTLQLRSLVRRFPCAVTADEADPHSIAAAINRLLADPQRAREMGEAGAGAFEKVFCYERQFGPVLDRLTALCQDRAAAR